MILATSSQHAPFLSLYQRIDEWAATRSRRDAVIDVTGTEWRPLAARHRQCAEPGTYRAMLKEARCIICDADPAIILPAQELKVPIIVFPRIRHDGGDQCPFAARLEDLDIVTYARSESDLMSLLDDVDHLAPPGDTFLHPPFELLARLHSFIHENPAEIVDARTLPWPEAAPAARKAA